MTGPLRVLRALAITCVFAGLAGGAPLAGQTAAEATVSGDVLDPSGAEIPDAQVTLHNAGGDHAAKTDHAGHFSVALPTGRYDLVVTAEGFRTYTRFGYAVGARPAALKLTLQIATQDEQIEVTADSALSTDQSANKSALVFKADQLDTFSDDPATMQQELIALGGGDPSTPPQIYVDGFSNGTMPPKETIREVRINQNPFSAAYDQFGLGRIEILTKPGAGQIHGSIEGNFGDSALDSNAYSAIHALNPASPEPGQPQYLYSYLDGNVNGPLGKHSSYYFSAGRNNLANNALVDATTNIVGGNTVYTTEAVPQPTLTQTYSLRFDHQFGKSDTLVSRYTYNNSHLTNGGVGQLVLADDGYTSNTRTQTLQLTDTHLFNAKVVLDTAFQYIRQRTQQDPNATTPGIVVSGAFNDGGSPTQSLHDDLDRFELQEYFSISEGKHFVRTGIRSRMNRDANYANASYNGVFTYTSLAAYASNPNAPSQFSIAKGDASVKVFNSDTELYGEDEWKWTPNFTLSYGLRLETESAIPNHLDVGPRLGTAWSVMPNKKAKTPLFVLRVGGGIFYQRFGYTNILTSLRQNGKTQQTYYVSNPGTTNLSTLNSLLTAQTPTVYLINPHLKSPSQNQFYGSVERALGKIGSVTFSGYVRRTNHMFESLNLNAPEPGTYVYGQTGSGVYPYGTTQPVYAFASDGVSNGHLFGTNVNLNPSKNFSYWAFVGIGHQESDVAGSGFGQSVAAFPSNSYNVKADAGPLVGYPARQLYTGGQYKPGWDTNIGFFLSARSSTHFNITTGTDLNGDAQYNDRPAFATAPTSASQIYKTQWGTFDANPQPGEAIIPNNYGTAPAFFFLGLNASKNIQLGPRKAAAPDASAPKPGEKAALPDRKYRIQLGLSADNVLNHVNAGAPVGVLTSPNFGKAITLNNPFVSNSSANRSIEFRGSFHF